MRERTPVPPGLIAAAGLLIACAPAWACSIPVFRYALERWPGDAYRIAAFHKGPLSPKLRAGLEAAAADAENEDQLMNLTVEYVDLDEQLDRSMRKLWSEQNNPAQPHAVLLDPRGQTIWAGALADVNLDRMVNSPTRQEVARRLLKGDSAVWVLLESGNKKQDEAAAKLLTGELKRLESDLKLPEPGDDEPEAAGSGTDGEPLTNQLPEVRVSFSMLRVSRTDPKESMFTRMLMNVEDDLSDFKTHPIVFPIFGRGRVLWAIVGKGITAKNIKDAATFLIGPCSCQVKDQNPGVDLLMMVDWENLIRGRVAVDKALPPLEGFSSILSGPAPDGPSVQADGDNAEVGGGGSLMRNLALAIGLGLAGLLAMTVLIKRKQTA